MSEDSPFLIILGICGTAIILLFIMDLVIWRRDVKSGNPKDFVFFKWDSSDSANGSGSPEGGSDSGGDCGGGDGGGCM